MPPPPSTDPVAPDTRPPAGPAPPVGRDPGDDAAGSPGAAASVLGALIVGYIGIYLCRKNLAVAMPLLQDAFHATREEVGRIASVATLAYAAGKLATGPIVDRIGGRLGFLAALALVAALGAVSAFAPGLGLLGLCYALGRFAGAAGWGAMVSVLPTWFGPRRRATAMAVLSLSYVAGGIAALLLGRQIVAWGGGWRAVMGVPALVLAAIVVPCALVVRRGPVVDEPAPGEEAQGTAGQGAAALARRVLGLLVRPRFLVVLGLSLGLTLVRESLNTWNVDFLASLQRGAGSVARAALQSTGFDLAGGISILAMGVAYDRTPPRARGLLVAGTVLLLAGCLVALPLVGRASPAGAAWLLAAVGLLAYGPYSLLAGTLALETGGARHAATAAGLVDFTGYLVGVLAGSALGHLVDRGGYALAFNVLGATAFVAALLALGLGARRAGP
ncbi:MAG: MFS transporter [Deltaproteobacteria bacterium]|nr:MFS transporter [Deltaproteobacteria bacterium]